MRTAAWNRIEAARTGMERRVESGHPEGRLVSAAGRGFMRRQSTARNGAAEPAMGWRVERA